MVRRCVWCAAMVAAGMLLSSPAHAIVGAGAHWGFDLSLNMDNTDGLGDRMSFDGLSLDMSSVDPDLGTMNELPIFIERLNWQRTIFDFGGKAYVDIIPVIDAVEVSVNFGVWEYEGALKYPVGGNTEYVESLSSSALQNGEYATDSLFEYASQPMTLEEYDKAFFGLSGTPYAKLHVDFTIRKNIFEMPGPVKLFKIYGGGGLSYHIGTPLLSSSLVEDVLRSSMEGAGDLSAIQGEVFTNEEVMKKIINELVAIAEPVVGMHIVAGAAVKVPVIPIGVYADGKFMIPFGELDPEVDLGGTGLLFNVGLSFGL